MAKARAGGGRGTIQGALLAQASRVAEALRANRLAYYAVAIAIMVALSYAAFSLRVIPLANYEIVYNNLVRNGVPPEVAKHSYLYANDPWIEYWLADYLHRHGIASWRTLTRDNPATHIFWYPWGRDFTKTEYPLLPAVASLFDDPVRGTALAGVYSATLAVAVVYLLLLYEYGLLAAIVGSLPLAFSYAAASRTFAGFAEKEGFSIVLFTPALLLTSIALSRRSLPAAVAAGLVAGLIVASWGGYALVALVLAATALLLPLAGSEKAEGLLRRVVLPIAAVYGAVGTLLVALSFGKARVPLLWLPLASTLAALALMRLARSLAEQGFTLGPLRGERRLYLAASAAVSAVALAALPALGLSGKLIATLLWPLKSLGLIKLPRILDTVAEMASATNPRIFRELLNNANVLTFLAPVLGVYALYRSLARGEVRLLPLAVAGLGLFYGTIGMIYLEQSFANASAILVGASVGSIYNTLAAGEEEAGGRRRGRRRQRGGGEARTLTAMALAVIVLLVVVFQVNAAEATAARLRAVVASATGFSINFQHMGWMQLLTHLRYEVPGDTVVVSWWDYGYWISVGSGRPTLADGATLNNTQITLLARFFTGTEEEANAILHEFGLKPNKTLIVVYDVALYDIRRHVLDYRPPLQGLSNIDLLKAGAMAHIAGRDAKFAELIRLANMAARGQAVREFNLLVNSTMIYKMFAAAPYYSPQVAVVVPKDATAILGEKPDITLVKIFGAQVSREFASFKHFKPYMLILAPLYNKDGKIVAVTTGEATYVPLVVLVVYQWTG
ncbi:MAG: hypothetical protein GXO15_06260 [Crenarchaeota archaeon]|nr:hypothetical protein [Thermoproteota archaeon]